MSGLNNDDDEALDNVDSLISRIKGNKKSEEPQVQKSTGAPLKASPRVAAQHPALVISPRSEKKWKPPKQRSLLPRCGNLS